MDSAFKIESFEQSAKEISVSDLKSINRCLVLVPHPDDESLACAGLIAKLNKQGAQVKFILTTDGSQSHPNSKLYPAQRLAKLREEELKEAITLLGLSPNTISFYKGRDSALPARGEDGFENLVSRLATDLDGFKPDLVLVPYELDPHRDHRATWQMLMAALERGNVNRPRIWEYPIWLYELADERDLPKLGNDELKYLNIASEIELKKKCINAHSSQTTKLIDDDPTGFILSEKMIANFTTGREYFMERGKINPNASLSEDYFETLYSSNIDPWNFEKSEYEREKYATSIQAIPQRQYEMGLEIGCSIGIFTNMIQALCSKLIAMDISGTALQEAKIRLANQNHVEFRLGGIPQNFPSEHFDLMVMSEVGYYLSMDDLMVTKNLIEKQLNAGGILLLVHWTHFVVDYPLSGDEVHACFLNSSLKHLNGSRTPDYRIDVFQK
ncbi:hypothetical protein DHW03_06455 [Pedobacter yonginense]|uniref:LmbE family protein n=1 Tax=Pedobacter yonginense TaxID=651869 RepID=A0A317ERB8_9SPHI|nr:bifunctional PIG-L family deacetylase/class I SAM-dependent methyltransferase [Pedobacter yonginense]PWS29451.1 hypothetical protein DHW03_06455 [Pedobacter yonginense]